MTLAMVSRREEVVLCHSVCIDPDPLQSLQANTLKTIMYISKGTVIGWMRISLLVPMAASR